MRIAIIMGSEHDWETMNYAALTLDRLGLEKDYDVRIISAHRTPDLLFEYTEVVRHTNIGVIIAGAGGAAHLPGMLAALTNVPVLGVPVESPILKGMDSLLSIVQMPAGTPVATFTIGRVGAINAALFAAQLIGLSNKIVSNAVTDYRELQRQSVIDNTYFDKNEQKFTTAD